MNELDRLYSPSYWSKRLSSPEEVIAHHLKFIEQASESVRAEIPSQLDISYGQSERQKFDIIGTDLSDDAPIFVFIHGGYWQTKEISGRSYHFIAKNLYKHDIKSIFLSYDLCPDVSLARIVEEIESAALKCLDYARKNNSKGLCFMGHSAGAHLVASLFATLPREKPSIVKGAILTSGVFDLSPLEKTLINEPLELDEKMASEMSPLKQNLTGGGGTGFYTVVGEHESPEFIKQSREFHQKLQDLGFRSTLSVIKDVDHYNIIELLSEEDFELTKLIISVINDE